MSMPFWGVILKWLIKYGLKSSVSSLRVQGALAYVKLIKGTRRMTILLCVLVLCAIVLGCGFLLVPVALCLFMPWTGETKAIVAGSVGVAYILIPLIVMLTLFSERRWLRVSKADKLVRAALRK